MANDVVKNLSTLLIRKDLTLPAFTLGDVTYEIRSKVPATALVALVIASSPIIGMLDYITECIASPEQKVSFRALLPDLDAEGLGILVNEIVAVTTPLEATPKPNASSSSPVITG